MAGIEIVRAANVAESRYHPIDGHSVYGDALVKLVSPAAFPLWLTTAALDDGAVLALPAVHGDEAVYVTSGALEIAMDAAPGVDRKACPESGAVVVESGAHPTITAVGPTTIVHVGPVEPVVPDDGLNGAPVPGDGVHVVGPGGTYAAVEPGRDTHYYADSTCPSCRLTLLYTSRSVEYVSGTHSHSTDELIHLLWGEIRLGNQVLRPGDTLAIAADQRYGFRSGSDGFGFLNYRRDASQQTIERGSVPRREGGLVNGLVAVMDLR